MVYVGQDGAKKRFQTITPKKREGDRNCRLKNMGIICVK